MAMEFLTNLFGRKQAASKDVARDRLKLVLIHDRANCSTQLLEMLRADIFKVISNYMEMSHKKENIIQIPEDPTKSINILEIRISKSNGSYAEIFDVFDEIRISIKYKVLTPVRGTVIYLWLKKYEANVFLATDTDDFPADFTMRNPGIFETTAIIPPGKLSVGDYYVDIGCAFHYREYVQQFRDCLSFNIYSKENRMTQSRASEGFVMASPVNWVRHT